MKEIEKQKGFKGEDVERELRNILKLRKYLSLNL